MFLQHGYDFWVDAAGYASASFESTSRGPILSCKPKVLTRPPMSLEKCVELEPKAAFKLLRRQSDSLLIMKMDEFLGDQWLLLDAEWRRRRPLDAILGVRRSSETLFSLAASMLTLAGDNSEQVGNTKGTAVLTMIGYGLIGLGAVRAPVIDVHAGCSLCWFRNRVPGSRFCVFHRYSHQRKGQENSYAARRRAERIKPGYWEREWQLRRRFDFYLIGLMVPRTGWWPLVDAYVVSAMSVAWLKEITDDCPHVSKRLGEALSQCAAREDWGKLFEVLREHVDPLDNKTNLDHWCAKLLEAEAWYAAEQEVSGQWSKREILAQDGRLLRSGQHVLGKRGPKQATRNLMKQAIELAKIGSNREQIAVSLAVQQRTLRQWEERHPKFMGSLAFYLNKHQHDQSL